MLRFSGGFLRTLVGRRLFTRFLLAAFVPAILTAVIAAWFVRSEVRTAIESKVGRSARLAGIITLATLERLDSAFQVTTTAVDGVRFSEWKGDVPQGFSSIESRRLAEGVPGDNGQMERPLTDDEQKHLATGRTLVVAGHGVPSTLRMATLGSSSDLIHWGRIADRMIWGAITQVLLDEQTRLCIVELPGDRLLACDKTVPQDVQHALGDIRGTGRVALASWKDDDTKMHAASWNVFLRFAYGAPDWRVVVSQESDATFASLRGFTLTFSGILLIALLVVLFLSHTQIRRSTEPLEQLQAGTRRLEQGDFATQVQVASNDEYRGLADSFNRMAETLDRQIITLRGLDELQQSVRGARDIRSLLEIALSKIGVLVQDADLLIAVEGADGTLEAVMKPMDGSAITATDVRLDDEERAELYLAPGGLSLPVGERRRFLAVAPFGAGTRAAFVFPFVHERRLLGFIAVGTPAGTPPRAEQREGVRRLVDRLTLAIADVQHVRRLAALSAGTMTAFARAIEANSRWTAGHSERVTALALMIGEGMHLSKDELAVLHRGGLLHDIGKIGVPTEILDKPARLTSAERAVVERHPVVGAEILSPIGAFTDAVPIVRSHHEQWNGAGYPDGLVGSRIPHLARILAVADVFDALVSDRPYRAGLSVTHAAGFIEIGSGTHFDPVPAAAFLDALRSGRLTSVLASFASEPLRTARLEDAA